MKKNFLSKIPVQWRSNNGFKVKVGIIDAGFDVNNIYLKDNIAQFKDYGSTNIDHGTHVMGIMCLHTNQLNVVKGLAYQSKYYLASIPMGEKNGMKYMCSAIQDMITFGVDVLNMSFTNYVENNTMKQLLFSLHQKNTLLISSYSDSLLFPHSYPFVISAGKQIVTLNSFTSSISNNSFKKISGTSMQSAYISSVAALAKGYDKKINKDQFIESVVGQSLLTNLMYEKRVKQYNLKIK